VFRVMYTGRALIWVGNSRSGRLQCSGCKDRPCIHCRHDTLGCCASLLSSSPVVFLLSRADLIDPLKFGPRCPSLRLLVLKLICTLFPTVHFLFQFDELFIIGVACHCRLRLCYGIHFNLKELGLLTRTLSIQGSDCSTSL